MDAAACNNSGPTNAVGGRQESDLGWKTLAWEVVWRGPKARRLLETLGTRERVRVKREVRASAGGVVGRKRTGKNVAMPTGEAATNGGEQTVVGACESEYGADMSTCLGSDRAGQSGKKGGGQGAVGSIRAGSALACECRI